MKEHWERQETSERGPEKADGGRKTGVKWSESRPLKLPGTLLSTNLNWKRSDFCC